MTQNCTRRLEMRSSAKAEDGRRVAFVRHYLIHQNASRAYREAGYQDGPGTRQSAYRLLTSAYIQARVSEERQKLLAALDVKVKDIMRRYRDIAFSDISNIVGCHYGACRYCHGNAHDYQWRTPREFQESLQETSQKLDENSRKPECKAEPEGGYGYDANVLPDTDCPMCDGDGIPFVKFKDTRLLTDAERAVFAGVKETPNGIHYRFHDQLAALKDLAKRLGFFN